MGPSPSSCLPTPLFRFLFFFSFECSFWSIHPLIAMQSSLLLVNVLPVALLVAQMLLWLVLFLWALNGAGVHLESGMIPRG